MIQTLLYYQCSSTPGVHWYLESSLVLLLKFCSLNHKFTETGCRVFQLLFSIPDLCMSDHSLFSRPSKCLDLFYLFLALFILSSVVQSAMAMVGAFGEVKAPDAEVAAVLQSVRPALEEQLKKQFTTLEVVHYKSQVVAGTNFLIKVCSFSFTWFFRSFSWKPLTLFNDLVPSCFSELLVLTKAWDLFPKSLDILFYCSFHQSGPFLLPILFPMSFSVV